jgi:hypothetical protein
MDKFFSDPMVGYGLVIGFSLGILVGGIFYSKYRWEKNITKNKQNQDQDKGFF